MFQDFLTQPKQDISEAPWGHCVRCNRKGYARNSDVNGKPLSDCCTESISHDPVTWNLIKIRDVHGTLIPLEHANYLTEKEAYEAGDMLMKLFPWIKGYRVEKCVSEVTVAFCPAGRSRMVPRRHCLGVDIEECFERR